VSALKASVGHLDMYGRIREGNQTLVTDAVIMRNTKLDEWRQNASVSAPSKSRDNAESAFPVFERIGI
jgi:hypothetical protein